MVNSSDVQRLYLQAILSRGLVSEALAKLLWKKCLDAVSGTRLAFSIHPIHYKRVSQLLIIHSTCPTPRVWKLGTVSLPKSTSRLTNSVLIFGDFQTSLRESLSMSSCV